MALILSATYKGATVLLSVLDLQDFVMATTDAIVFVEVEGYAIQARKGDLHNLKVDWESSGV